MKKQLINPMLLITLSLTTGFAAEINFAKMDKICDLGIGIRMVEIQNDEYKGKAGFALDNGFFGQQCLFQSKQKWLNTLTDTINYWRFHGLTEKKWVMATQLRSSETHERYDSDKTFPKSNFSGSSDLIGEGVFKNKTNEEIAADIISKIPD